MKITKIYPPCWFAKMNNPILQLVICGGDLANAHVDIMGKPNLNYEIISNTNNCIVLNVDTSDAKSNTTYSLQLKRNNETVEEEYKFCKRPKTDLVI